MRQQLLGDNHPHVATSLNNLGHLYYSQVRYSEAEPLYLEAINIATQALGENHPNTVTIRENLQIMRQQQHPSP
ncbi:MAG: tetratricopeptide repeat protein [Microcystis sp.]|uniref:tetratricopeptide repeat protein n=1 Tax=Microcystis sp. TaxID=1127 RepID=UPI00391B4C64